jgi:hypothetical protein
LSRKNKLKLDALKPYDLSVEENGEPALVAFENGNDLLQKGKKVFSTRYNAREGYNKITIPASAYNKGAGTYFINVQGGDFSQTERLIVQ